jgi:hypothetical protein
VELEHHKGPCRCSCLLTPAGSNWRRYLKSSFPDLLFSCIDCGPAQTFDSEECRCSCDRARNPAKYSCAQVFYAYNVTIANQRRYRICLSPWCGWFVHSAVYLVRTEHTFPTAHKQIDSHPRNNWIERIKHPSPFNILTRHNLLK